MQNWLQNLVLIAIIIPAGASVLFGIWLFWRYSRPTIVRSAPGTLRWIWAIRISLSVTAPVIFVVWTIALLTEPVSWTDLEMYKGLAVMFSLFFVPLVLTMRVHLSNQSRIHEPYDYLNLPRDWKPPRSK